MAQRRSSSAAVAADWRSGGRGRGGRARRGRRYAGNRGRFATAAAGRKVAALRAGPRHRAAADMCSFVTGQTISLWTVRTRQRITAILAARIAALIAGIASIAAGSASAAAARIVAAVAAIAKSGHARNANVFALAAVLVDRFLLRLAGRLANRFQSGSRSAGSCGSSHCHRSCSRRCNPVPQAASAQHDSPRAKACPSSESRRRRRVRSIQ